MMRRDVGCVDLCDSSEFPYARSSITSRTAQGRVAAFSIVITHRREITVDAAQHAGLELDLSSNRNDDVILPAQKGSMLNNK